MQSEEEPGESTTHRPKDDAQFFFFFQPRDFCEARTKCLSVHYYLSIATLWVPSNRRSDWNPDQRFPLQIRPFMYAH